MYIFILSFINLRKLSERIYYLPHEKKSDRPVLGYIKGNKYALVVDAGNSSKHVQKLYDELKKANLSLPDYTVITHWHWDHTFGMHSVVGKTISGHLTNRKLHEVSQWEWSNQAMRIRLDKGKEIEMCDRCIRIEYPNRQQINVVTSNIEFNGRMKIDLGNIFCELIEVDAPHSDDSVLIYIPEERTLFVGDADGVDYYKNNGKYNKQKLRYYIDIIKEIKFETYVLGHGEPESREQVLSYLEKEYDKLI